MKDETNPAFPCKVTGYFRGEEESTITYVGLSKREYFAGLAMQGFCATDGQFAHPQILVKEAIRVADELIKQLNQE